MCAHLVLKLHNTIISSLMHFHNKYMLLLLAINNVLKKIRARIYLTTNTNNKSFFSKIQLLC